GARRGDECACVKGRRRRDLLIPTLSGVLGGDMALVEYPFPDNPAATRYCVFPAALEDDELVFFHATPLKHFVAIKSHGYRIPDPTGMYVLPSVSFANRSAAALSHAVYKRVTQPGA